ncbi:MAG: hypothetical protein EOP51_09340 [Sphingobacteriales bacterium]|nr:MAG: hypothetical protein EOP51_09340 [Sphingobacteriales bacterium]
MKRILLSFACLLLGNQLFASHAQGAQIKYAYNGSGYTIYLEQYKACGAGIPFPSTAYVSISSVSLGTTVTVALPMVQQDTVDYSCPYNTNSCVVPSSSEPAKIIAQYADNVSLLPANDWVISFFESARAFTSNYPSDNLYVEATLDNSSGVNSSPVWPIMENYYLEAGTAFSYPKQLVDVDGDSLDLKFAFPQNGHGSSVTPFVGVTLSNPFGFGGGSASITSDAINFQGNSAGAYTVALRVDEYRAGSKIGSYTRDFMISLAPSPVPNNVFTFPKPASGSVFEGTACAGQSGSLTVNLSDVSTDSIHVDVTAPSLSGWTFTPMSSSGLGSGSAGISYTAPVTMSPGADPIVVPVYVYDNSCPRAAILYNFIIRPGSCLVDSVWPGDANSDNVVNLYDPLYVALAYGKTGSTRAGASTSWVGQYCADWATHFPLSGVNHKHADCNGDGTVDITDLGAVISNYSLTHTRPAQRTNAGAPLKFDLTGVNFFPGSTVSIPIVLGDATTDVNMLFGMATRISIGGITLDNAPIVTNNITWMGAISELMNFNKSTNNNSVDWVQAHIDNNYNNGNGVVGTLEFTIPITAPEASTIS